MVQWNIAGTGPAADTPRADISTALADTSIKLVGEERAKAPLLVLQLSNMYHKRRGG